jgi:SSS family solute:Na+ symporter
MTTSLFVGTLVVYYLGAILIGSVARRFSKSTNAFLHADRELPLAVAAASFLAINSGALEAIGLSAMAAEYGVQAFHFYWIGAIPAMIFAGLWLMPIYRKSGVKSVPQFFELRYGARMRLANSCALLLILPALAGIGLYAAALILQLIAGLAFAPSVCLAAAVVLTYTLLGGIRATIYNEVVQLVLMVVGVGPLAVVCAIRLSSLSRVEASTKTHLWTALPIVRPSAPLDIFGVVVGLGLLLSFSYWCTDFVLVQRAFTARTDQAARRVPLFAGFGKLIFSMLIVVPGLLAGRTIASLGSSLRFDQTLPLMMERYYNPFLMSLGVAAIAASLTSALAANVTAVGALWTSDVYRRYIRPQEDDAHYMFVGRMALIAATLISVTLSFFSFFFGNLMEYVQMIFSIFGIPFWAVFLLGVTSEGISEDGALLGALGGAVVGALNFVIALTRHLAYGSPMAVDFYGAIYSFAASIVIAWIASSPFRRGNILGNSPIRVTPKMLRSTSMAPLDWILAVTLAGCCVALNYWWR